MAAATLTPPSFACRLVAVRTGTFPMAPCVRTRGGSRHWQGEATGDGDKVLGCKVACAGEHVQGTGVDVHGYGAAPADVQSHGT